MQYGFGVDLGGTTVKLGFFNAQGTLLDKWEIPTDTSDAGSRILPDIGRSILSYLETKQIPREQILGVGIGVPGPVRPDGTVNRCVNLGWGAVDIPGQLGSITGFPVKAGNDANVAALGECRVGGGRGCENMLMITLGTGVGGGLVLGGKLVHGVHGAGGEIGHICVDPQEQEVCGCGRRGCLEQYCSATGVVRLARRFLSAEDTPSVLRGQEAFTCKDVFDAAAAEDPAALQILEKMYSVLAYAIANLCCSVDPQVVVLGGGVSKAGKPLLEGVRRHFKEKAFYACRDTEFALATLGNDAGACGAFQLLL